MTILRHMRMSDLSSGLGPLLAVACRYARGHSCCLSLHSCSSISAGGLLLHVQLYWSKCETTSKRTHSTGFSESTGEIGGAGTPLFCLSARRSMARRTESRQFDPPARRARGTTCLRNVPERPCNALQSPAAGLQGRAPPGCLLRPMCGHASGAIGAGGPRSLCAYRPTVLTTTVSS